MNTALDNVAWGASVVVIVVIEAVRERGAVGNDPAAAEAPAAEIEVRKAVCARVCQQRGSEATARPSRK